MHRLLLFDIDGTLLRCGPQVAPIFLQALESVFGGYRVPEGFSFAGRTDTSIVTEMVGHLGLKEGEILRRLPQMRESYVEVLEASLDRERMRLLPGVLELLDHLAGREDICLGLLTGNWQEGARIKLGRFELGAYFPFGAFGDDGHDRRELVPVALDRAAAHAGRQFDPEDVLIIGDTVLDIDCAAAAGIQCLAVATGFTPAQTLEDAGATWVYEDLASAAAELAFLQ